MKQTKFAGLLMSILIMLVLVVQPSFKVGALPATVYDAVLDPLPYNMPSIGFQATSTSEFGDYIHLAGTNRTLQSVTVTMSTWARNSEYPSMPSTGWSHPITVNIYNAVPGAPLNTVGALLATLTETKTIPWRPEGDPTCPNTGYGAGFGWRAPDTNCYNGLAFNLTFDMSSLNVTLPDDIIVGVAYNTQTYGAVPIGSAGPYNSLNVAVQAGPATVGTDDNLDRVFADSTWAGFYTDGGAAGLGIFREDTGWTAYGTVALRIVADPPPAPAVLVNPTSLDFGDVQVFNWSASQTVTLTNTGAGDLHIGAITNDGDFWVTPWNDNCSNQTIIPSGTCTFDVIFTPSSTGPKTGTVSIPSDAASTPDTVALTGNGVASEIQVTPSPLAFGSRLVNSSTTLTATITNIGSADLHIGVLTITGAAYSLVNNLCDNVTLIPNGTCTFGVTFTPPAAGPSVGEVSIPNDSGGLVESDQAKAFQYFPVITPLPLTGTGILAQTTLVMRSNGGYDGTVREFKKDAGYGGFNEPISALISVGDDYLNRQYVGILDFNTSSIPDNAVITSVKVRVKGMILATTTYTRLGEMTADIMNPHFGTSAGLENLDFQAAALFKNVGTFTHAPTYYKWITMNVKPAAFTAVNLTGTTQFRLHFQKKYFDNNIKEMLRFLSGDFWIPTDFPMLVVTYYVP